MSFLRAWCREEAARRRCDHCLCQGHCLGESRGVFVASGPGGLVGARGLRVGVTVVRRAGREGGVGER